MSTDELLSKEEIDTLLTGVDEGAVETETAEVNSDAVPYDLTRQDQRGEQLPAQAIINERFARYSSISMFNMLRETLEVTPVPVEVLPYGEYLQTLAQPTSINQVKIEPYKGTALLVLKSDLVSLMVDRFFGGEGSQLQIQGRDFTTTEDRIIQKVMSQIYADLTEAWNAVQEVKFVWQRSETNPVMATAISDHETVVVSSFVFRLQESEGYFQIVIPYAMLESMRKAQMPQPVAEQQTADNSWSDKLLEDIMDAPVPISCKVLERKISLREVLNFKVGDVIPITMPDSHELQVRDISLFKTRMGTSNDYLALQIIDAIKPETH